MRGRRGGTGQHRFRVVLATVVAVALVAVGGCTGDDVARWEAEDASLRTTSTTATPPPGLERVEVSAGGLDTGTDSRFTGVVVGALAIVVIGDQAGEAAIWTTFDGVFFDEVELDDADFPPGTVLADVVATEEGFVAVGRAGGRAAAWASLDGRNWIRAGLDGGEVADVVIVGELGIAAFGRDGDALAVWTSFDGVVWERVPGGGGVFDDRPGPAEVVDAYDDGDGFVAVVERAGVVEAWRSADGRSWTADPVDGAELLPADGTPRAEALLGAGSTVVVLGSVVAFDGIDAAVWTSIAGEPWQRATPSEAVFGGDGAQVALAGAQLGPDLVVVGTDTDDEGDVDAVLWSTTGSGGWQRSPAEGDGLSGAGDQHAVDIAATRDGAVVVGWEAADGATRAVAWSLVGADEAPPEPPAGGTSLGWRRLAPQDALRGTGEQRMDDLVATADGFLAVGTSAAADPGAGLDGAVWRSDDGTEWERVDTTDAALGGLGDQRLLGVTTVAGGFVAVGADGDGAGVWTSEDGRTWGSAQADPAAFDGPGADVAVAVAVGPDGSLVAVGESGGDAAVWRADGPGATWERAGSGDLGGDGAQAMTDVDVVGPLLVAVGASDGMATSWVSLDGSDWQRADLGPGRAEAVAAVEDGGAVAAGWVTGGDGDRDAAAWRSPDGRSWVAVPVDDAELGGADQEVLDVAATTTADGNEVLAGVGWTDLGPGNDAAAWTSEDGATWFRTPHDEDVFGGDQAQRMQAVTGRDGVAVAVGWSGTEPGDRDAAVWVTAPAGGGSGIL